MKIFVVCMLELTLKGGIGFTEKIFIAKVMVYRSSRIYLTFIVAPEHITCNPWNRLAVLQVAYYSELSSMSANQSITAQYLQIAIYVGSPKYQGILQYLESPFISVCQYITAFISYHRASHNCYLYRLN